VSERIETVMAGSGDFVAAIAPTVKFLSGVDPRLAGSPRQAFTLCAETGGLLVVQYGGPEWLAVARDLRSLCGDAISMVFAVEAGHSFDVGGLQRVGVDEIVPWDGRPDSVSWAVERCLVSRRSRAEARAAQAGPADRGYVAPAHTAAPPPILQRLTPAAGMPAVPQPAPGAAPAEPQVGGPEPAPTPTSLPRSPAAASWPANLPEGPDAEWLLLAALTGAASAPGPQRDAAHKVSKGLTELERGVLLGGDVPVDGALVRLACGLRLRVALALASIPPPGTAIDGAAVQGLLAELDQALTGLKAAGEGGPPEVLPGLEALRSALVHEAIDLTEAVQRLAPAGGAAAPAVPAAVRTALAQPATRVLSVRKEEADHHRLPVGWLVALGIAVAAAGGYHLNQSMSRTPAPTFSYSGAPQGAIASSAGPGKPIVLVKVGGGAFDPAELQKLKAQEELMGRTVQLLAPGTVVIIPEKAAPARAPAPPLSTTQEAKP